MPIYLVNVMYGKQIFNEIKLDTDVEPLEFKLNLLDLTGIGPYRQKLFIPIYDLVPVFPFGRKIFVKRTLILDNSWDNIVDKIQDGVTIHLIRKPFWV